jgi:hypothetical protein
MNDQPAPRGDFSMVIPANQTAADRQYAQEMSRHFAGGIGSDFDKLRNFARYVPRQALSLFLAKHEIFRSVLEVHGHIVECGVFLGGGLMTWANLSAIYEPINHVRRIVGFDSFSGFPSLHERDANDADNLAYKRPGGLATNARADLEECIRLYDLNRPVGHIPRVELVAGDAAKTIPQYVRDNQHLVVALLYLDFDLYEPTLAALQQFLPRMPKGAVLVFDELNQAAWPGETLAVLEAVGLRSLRIRRFPFVPQLSYAVLE